MYVAVFSSIEIIFVTSLSMLTNCQEACVSSVLTQDSRSVGGNGTEEFLNWTQRTANLLEQLLDVLSKTIKSWEGFNSWNRDIGYFSSMEISAESDPSRLRARLSLRAINETFERLQNCQQLLLSLKHSCDNSAQAVSSFLIIAITISPRGRNLLTSIFSFNFG